MAAGLLWGLVAGLSAPGLAVAGAGSGPGANRFTHLDETDPFYVDVDSPRLATPQWVGDDGVEAVVTLTIDDLNNNSERFEEYMRPALDRLQEIDGRAPFSVYAMQVDAEDPIVQRWLEEGVSIECHTLTHPCPILSQGNLEAAKRTIHDGIDHLTEQLGQMPTTFRTPCADAMNSVSPRIYAELLSRPTAAGNFLQMDSSVLHYYTPDDAELPRKWVMDGDQERFTRYRPEFLGTSIENHPYPYVINNLMWQLPIDLNDWQGQRQHGVDSPQIVEDWKRAADLSVVKQGMFNLVIHPHGHIDPQRMVELIDYIDDTYGQRVKFLNKVEVLERLTENLLAGHPLRAADGGDNGVRLLDLTGNGYMDVVIANSQTQKTRLWDEQTQAWRESVFPVALIDLEDELPRQPAGRFAVLGGDPVLLVHTESKSMAWRFADEAWQEAPELLDGLDALTEPIYTRYDGRDRGVRFRDVLNTGNCNLIVGNPDQNAVFVWSDEEHRWERPSWGSLPDRARFVDEQSRDAGLRFVDLNQDGYDDVIFSNAERFGVYLMVPSPEALRAFDMGWVRAVQVGERGETEAEIPAIVRDGPYRNNGVWFDGQYMWVQNEDTSDGGGLPDREPLHARRIPYSQLMVGYLPEARSPEQSLAAMDVIDGFTVELVASEPLVMDPIAIEWAPDGRLWVVEMGDYPRGLDDAGDAAGMTQNVTPGEPGGRIVVLEDTTGDGQYDNRRVFMDGLRFPGGVMPWRDGVIIANAPQVFYAEDTTGDGKADTFETLLEGFRIGNPQHQVNGFHWGLDNRVYGTPSSSGGEIHSPKSGQTVRIDGHDFRFDPDTGHFEAVSGVTQFARHRDDWGNWFGRYNVHYHLPANYLHRNPHVATPSTHRALGMDSHMYRISDMMARPQRGWAIAQVVSANNLLPYRDELFGGDFLHSLFASEPDKNVVHRAVLEVDGVSFRASRAAGEQEREFLASRDNWFRPTALRTGPDGALYIGDMYRLIIEYAGWYPPDMQDLIDFRAGHDRGRIYRVYPENAELRPIPRLDRMSTLELVEALDTPNGWQRDTAHRLLVHSGDQQAVPPLESLVKTADRAVARMQALWVLEGLSALSDHVVAHALQDEHPGVREQAVRVSQSLMTDEGPPASVAEVLLKLVDDPELRVRFQLAFSLGEWQDPQAGEALAALWQRDAADEVMRAAMLSSALPHGGRLLVSLLEGAGGDSDPPYGLDQVAGMVVRADEVADLSEVFRAVGETGEADAVAPWQMATLSDLIDALQQRDRLEEHADEIAALKPLFARARELAIDPQVDVEVRLAAVGLLGRDPAAQQADIEALTLLLDATAGVDLQRAAVRAMGRMPIDVAGPTLLAQWSGYTPTLRMAAMEHLLSRPGGAQKLIDAVDEGRLPAMQVAPGHRERLLEHDEQEVREAAERLFGTVASVREEVVQSYSGVSDLNGDPLRGRQLFVQACLACHQLGNVGTSTVGPELTVEDWSVGELLTAVFDPNRVVDPQYVAYTALLADGRQLAGRLAEETQHHLTLRTADGETHRIPREEVEALIAQDRSLMPEGFEDILDPQDMADLISYLTDPTSEELVRAVSGEVPAVVEAFAEGAHGSYERMDYGPVIGQSVRTDWFDDSIVTKALAVHVPGAAPAGGQNASVVFDTDTLRYAAAAVEGWIDISRTDLASPKGDQVASIEGEQTFGSRDGVGWTTPEHGFDDPRDNGLGPLPRSHGRYGGYYRHGDSIVLSYEVFGNHVLDLPGALAVGDGQHVFTRKLYVEPAEQTLIARVGDAPADADVVKAVDDQIQIRAGDHILLAAIASGTEQGKLRLCDAQRRIELVVKASPEPRHIALVFGRVEPEQASAVFAVAQDHLAEPRNPADLIHGGPTRWDHVITVAGSLGEPQSGYAVDEITLPHDNPWGAWMRPTGFDFFPCGQRAAVCTKNGDVWVVSGLDETLEALHWQRIASGMFHPMGVVVDEKETIYVIERGQLTRLHDLNGDGEVDFYESFNNDWHVHPRTHSLTLHRDAEGYFYFFRNGNRVSGDVPDHGRMMRVSPDGERREIFAHGFRGSNGMGIADDGTILAGDQEGNWVPATRIDRVERDGFYGYRPHGGEHLPVGEYEPPICWLPRTVDASAGEQAWIPPDSRWGPLGGRWVHTSYTHCSLAVLFYEEIDGQVQGGVVPMPLDFGAGLMRARFNREGDGQLYVAGLGSWGSLFSQRVGCFNRVRYVGGPVNLPKSLNVTPDGLAVTFTDPLDIETAGDPDNYTVQRWQYRYTAQYGSAEYSIEDPEETGRDTVQVTGVQVSDDGRQILVQIEDLKPVMQMRLGYDLRTEDGQRIRNAIYHTIHRVPE